MRRFALLLAALAILAPAALAQGWRVHTDPVGTRIELPAGFVQVGPGAPDGSGARFRADDGAEVRVYGSINRDRLGMADILAALIANNGAAYRDVTYRQAGRDWFVLSGYRDNRTTIFYARYELSQDDRVISAFEITYPARLRRAYDSIVTRMSLNFRAVPVAAN
jgi:hypothetical protein